jgi:hypothetical protein
MRRKIKHRILKGLLRKLFPGYNFCIRRNPKRKRQMTLALNNNHRGHPEGKIPEEKSKTHGPGEVNT